MMQNLVIAIDGPVGSGKSTVARKTAALLGYTYVDSGAMYRAVALKALRQGIPLEATEKMEALAAETRVDLKDAGGRQKVMLDGEDVSEAIRTAEVAQAASRVAQIPGVRRVLVAEQQRLGGQGGIVMEGRDIGSVVFPRAGLKIFLTAAAEVRAQRRWNEMRKKGESVELEELTRQVRERDARDTEREVSPLVCADDAVVIDSSAMEAEEVARTIALLANECLRAPA
jgi:CMP/dCMP kinase